MDIPFSPCRTEKHTLNSIPSYCPSHRHYCTKHQLPLLLQCVAISIRNIFARDDMYVHADVHRRVRKVYGLLLTLASCKFMSMRYVLNYFILYSSHASRL